MLNSTAITPTDTHALELTAEIVAAYVSNNPVSPADLPALITSVRLAIAGTAQPPEQEAAALTPAVPIRKSVQVDFLICLEDGKKFKCLKRHLRTRYNLSPEEYRAKWGLPADYPMVAPNYSLVRSRLAKDSGLGTKGVSH